MNLLGIKYNSISGCHTRLTTAKISVFNFRQKPTEMFQQEQKV
ncbi:hypothetical protein MtrunA17_Chr4g0012831 [Medicago truncatula]|uniref:Uncharacterized protein n=1 Tax=Medicago truncatula TaxID=3880 RepID=A0A396I6W9_MEDTR|nr:hypothetical protein MtrunA17_Chr4g0012831 [Medicago truncatula]